MIVDTGGGTAAMRPMTRATCLRLAAGTVLIAAVVGGCSGGSGSPAASTPSAASPAPSVSMSGSSPDAGSSASGATGTTDLTTTLDSASPAVGGLIAQRAVQVERLRDGDLVRVLAIGPDGTLLLSAGKDAAVSQDAITLGPQRVGLSGPGGAQPIRWVTSKPAAAKARDIWAGALSQDWAVWGEGSSTDLAYLDIALVSMNRRTGATHRLASSVQVDGHAVTVPGYNRPVIVGDRVVWADVVPTKGAQPPPVGLYSQPLDGRSGPKLEVTGAFLPTADACTGPTSFLYAAAATVGAKLPAGTVQIHRRTLAANGTASDTVVRTLSLTTEPLQTLSDLAGCGPTVAVATATDNDTELTTGELRVFGARGEFVLTPQPDSRPNGLVATERLVGFTAVNGPLDGGQWVLDLQTGRLGRLPVVAGGQQLSAAGAWLAWRDSAGATAFRTIVGQVR